MLSLNLNMQIIINNKRVVFYSVPGFLPTVLPPKDSDSPTNGHGYIQFEINDELPVEVARRQRPIEQTVTRSRTETVNEVLSNLFPKGFSDIFRFSGNTDTSTTTSTTTNKAVVRPTVVDVVSTTEAASTEKQTKPPAPNATYYSYQTTVTKEYRRELGPGHTEIVVEQIRDPGFRDGSNHISRDELLRINRAAVAAPVLPSVLLQPEGDDNETLVAAESSPIVILGEHDPDLEEGQEINDNQIAETRHVGREAYQQRVPAPNFNGIESYANQKGPGQDQEINVHIVHDGPQGKPQQAEAKVGWHWRIRNDNTHITHIFRHPRSPSRSLRSRPWITSRRTVSRDSSSIIPVKRHHHGNSSRASNPLSPAVATDPSRRAVSTTRCRILHSARIHGRRRKGTTPVNL